VFALLGSRLPDRRPRFASSGGDLSGYHIVLEPAHTIRAGLALAIATSGYTIKTAFPKISPLTGTQLHLLGRPSQVKGCSRTTKRQWKCFCDVDKIVFCSWLKWNDIDTFPTSASFFHIRPCRKSKAAPVVLAALCGFTLQNAHRHIPNSERHSAASNVAPLGRLWQWEHFGLREFTRFVTRSATVTVRGTTKPLHCIQQLFRYV